VPDSISCKSLLDPDWVSLGPHDTILDLSRFWQVSQKIKIRILLIRSRSWPDPIWTSLAPPGTNWGLSRICSAAQNSKSEFYRSKADPVQIQLAQVWNHTGPIWTWPDFFSISKIRNLIFRHSKQILTRPTLDQFGFTWDQFGSEQDLLSSSRFQIFVL
jgi:hypothetical protein